MLLFNGLKLYIFFILSKTLIVFEIMKMPYVNNGSPGTYIGIRESAGSRKAFVDVYAFNDPI